MEKPEYPAAPLIANLLLLTLPAWGFSLLVLAGDRPALGFLGDEGWTIAFFALPIAGLVAFWFAKRLSFLSGMAFAVVYYPAALCAEFLCGLILVPSFS